MGRGVRVARAGAPLGRDGARRARARARGRPLSLVTVVPARPAAHTPPVTAPALSAAAPNAAPVRLDAITAADWQPAFGALGQIVEDVDDVAQCLGIILRTPQGSVPHRPDFGVDLAALLDAPALPGAAARVVAAVTEALARWEPRAVVGEVRVAWPAPGTLTLTVVWRPASGVGASGAPRRTPVTVRLGAALDDGLDA